MSGAWARPELVARFAARAEVLGYHGLWAYQRLLESEGHYYRSVLDPMLTLTFAAAHTSTIRLGIAVINIPYISPTYLAKQSATLDVLSGGRHDLGLGTGWSEPELQATGSDPNPRGKRVKEYVSVLRTLWTDDVASFDGELYQLPPSRMAPRPVQAGGPPLLLGGTAEVALRRAGRLANGWMSSSRVSFDTVARGVQLVRHAAQEAGRDPERTRIVVRGVVRPGARDERFPLSGSWDQIRAGAERYAEAGVTELNYDLNWVPEIGSPDADPAAAAERAEEMLSELAPKA
jgi:probable F420-dependent oxidoreductase